MKKKLFILVFVASTYFFFKNWNGNIKKEKNFFFSLNLKINLFFCFVFFNKNIFFKNSFFTIFVNIKMENLNQNLVEKKETVPISLNQNQIVPELGMVNLYFLFLDIFIFLFVYYLKQKLPRSKKRQRK